MGVGVWAALLACTVALGQTKPVRVPFVGCNGIGQAGPIKAGFGRPRTVHIPQDKSLSLAYYSGARLGVLAPRGWSCFCTYGSGGEALFVSPDVTIERTRLSDDWSGLTGHIVEVRHSLGSTSGMFTVARVIARVFPSRLAFARELIKEGDFAVGPYPTDQLAYKGKENVEFQTPAKMKGLGTELRLLEGSEPIRGVAMLVGPTPDLIFLAARLPANLVDLVPYMIRQVERDAKSFQ